MKEEMMHKDKQLVSIKLHADSLENNYNVNLDENSKLKTENEKYGRAKARNMTQKRWELENDNIRA